MKLKKKWKIIFLVILIIATLFILLRYIGNMGIKVKEYKIINNFSLPSFTISDEEKKYQALWSSFFKTIAIKERTNKRLQMQYMPKKYWQDLVELN